MVLAIVSLLMINGRHIFIDVTLPLVDVALQLNGVGLHLILSCLHQIDLSLHHANVGLQHANVDVRTVCECAPTRFGSPIFGRVGASAASLAVHGSLTRAQIPLVAVETAR